MSFLYLVLLLAAGALLEHLSRRHCLDRLSYDLRFDRTLAECGETFEMTSTVSNGRRLPVMYLRVMENVPEELTLEEDGGVERRERTLGTAASKAFIHQTMAIMPRRSAERRLRASLPARGRYVFRGATLTAGDLIGLHEESMEIKLMREIVIYPKKIDVPSEEAFGGYLGDVSVRRYILSDPILTVGFREYTGREPQRDISWPRSLRDNRLMVKQYDYTAEPTATVLLNIAGGSAAQIERCYGLARGVCEELERRRVSYSFLTNAGVAGAAGMWTYLGDGTGRKHLMTILEGLGRALYEPVFSFDRLLSSAAKGTDDKRAFILITPVNSREVLSAVKRFETRVGQRVFVIEAGEVEQ